MPLSRNWIERGQPEPRSVPLTRGRGGAPTVSHKQAKESMDAVRVIILCITFHIAVATQVTTIECHISNLKDDYAIFVEDTRSRACPGARRCCHGPSVVHAAHVSLAVSSPSTPGMGFRPWRSRQRPARKDLTLAVLPGSRRTRVLRRRHRRHDSTDVRRQSASTDHHQEAK